MSSAASLAPPHFSTLSHKRHDFSEKHYRTQDIFLLFLQLLFERFLSLRRVQRVLQRKTNKCAYDCLLTNCSTDNHNCISLSFFIKPALMHSMQHTRLQRDIVINVKTSRSKVPVMLIGFERNLNSLGIFSKKNPPISVFIKIGPVGVELLHADRRTRRS